MRVRSLDQEDPLEEEMATHASSLAWRTPWTEEPGRLQCIGSQKSNKTAHKTLWRQLQKITDKYKWRTGMVFYEQMNILTILMGEQINL